MPSTASTKAWAALSVYNILRDAINSFDGEPAPKVGPWPDAACLQQVPECLRWLPVAEKIKKFRNFSVFLPMGVLRIDTN